MSKKDNIKLVFFKAAFNYTKDTILVNSLWCEIENEYSSEQRYYHNLEHLKYMYLELKKVRRKIEDWDTIIFSMFYHDIVYIPQNINNEKYSADVAADRLKQLSFPEKKMEMIISNICATQYHKKQVNNDLNFFLDADLSILGAKERIYFEYKKSIENEFSSVSQFIYKAKRDKVLHEILKQERIFKTDFFEEKYESRARQNINRELAVNDDTRLNSQYELFQILERALIEKNATEFVYEWEWEMWFLPTQTILINDESIHHEYDLTFEFGEQDIDELVKAGYYEKLSKVEEGEIMTITYKKST